MGGTKRMSKDEKRQVILGIYHKSLEVYTEKEILALAAKAGVTANSIPEIHQSLIDDGLVDKEKIGGSNYFWSFPQKKDRQAQKQHEAVLRALTTAKADLEAAETALADAKRGREEEGDQAEQSGETRAAKLARWTTLQAKKKTLQEELDTLKENDPAALADLEKEYQMVKDAAYRWTDNIEECKSYLVKKRNMDKKQAAKMLQIGPNFDYPEEK